MKQYPFVVNKYSIEGQHVREYVRSTAKPDQAPWIEIKQYIPTQNIHGHAGDATVIFSAGIGFVKETYEPFFEELVHDLHARGCRIRSIWVADMNHIGSSAIKNTHILGNDPNWWDHSRDLLLMINKFRSKMPRPLIGMGHSMGAAQIGYLSTIHPSLFTSLVFIEPQIHDGVDREVSLATVKAMALRKDSWKTRSAAEKALRKSPYLSNWDPRALDKFLEYSLVTNSVLYNSSSDETHTTTPKSMEVALAVRPNPIKPRNPSNPRLKDMKQQERERVPDLDPTAKDTYPMYRAEPTAMYRLLPSLRPSVLWVYGESSRSSPTGAIRMWEKITGTGIGGSGGKEAGRVKLVCIENGEHTLPMDKSLYETAKAVGIWFNRELKKWKENEQILQREWVELELREKQSINPILQKVAKDYSTEQSLEEFVEKQSKL